MEQHKSLSAPMRLIQKKMEFANLGLAVVDEQHRFGVLQREALGKKGLGTACCSHHDSNAYPSLPGTHSLW